MSNNQALTAWAEKYAIGPVALEALYVTLSNTPAARWRENGGEDPFGTRYGCERAALAMGHLTDDELANAVYLHGDERPRLDKMLSKDYVSPSAYLTAAKDRIRWLSRKLVEAEQLAISAEDANAQLTAEKDARGSSGYTSAMGEAAEKYHSSFEHAHPLPAQWRWEDVWAAMSRAAASPIGEYVDPVTRHWPKVQVIGWKATTVEHLFAVLSQLSKTLCRAEDKQLLARVWRIDSPLLRLISGAPAAPDDSYRQLLEAAMTTASEAMDYVQRNARKFNARPGDDKLEIVCREFLRAQTQNTLAVPTNLGDNIKALRTYANGYYVRRDEVLAAIESTPAAPGIDLNQLQRYEPDKENKTYGWMFGMKEDVTGCWVHIEDLRTLIDASPKGGSDSARLDFVLLHMAWVCEKKADSGATTYWLETQDEDENYIRLSGDDFYRSPREAIDAAMQAASVEAGA